jgi:hypothetical protein
MRKRQIEPVAAMRPRDAKRLARDKMGFGPPDIGDIVAALMWAT